MRNFIEEILNTGNYNLAQMEERIQKMYVLGKLSEDDMTYLLNLAAENANDNLQIDVASILADFEQRISALESAGIKVWVSGMVTAKGQTVLFDPDKDGVLDRCRYDGGRQTTSSSPGKIEGWVVVDGSGNVTHRLVKNSDGQIEKVPVEEQGE